MVISAFGHLWDFIRLHLGIEIEVWMHQDLSDLGMNFLDSGIIYDLSQGILQASCQLTDIKCWVAEQLGQYCNDH